ncbi:Protein-glutamate methylesterase/protein-glutamine glutaminase [subsurface metagenome]
MTKILVIDDDRINLKVLEVLLKNSYPDYEISTAQSGSEGIEKAKKELPDIIILDVRMPDMDGYEVCKRLQSDEYTQPIPVIFLTAYETDSKDVIRGLESGALSFLSKPIDKDHLIAHVNVALRIKHAEDTLRESEEKYRNIVEMSPDGIATSSLTGFMTSCNTAFLELTGFDHDDLVGKHFTKLPTLQLKDLPKFSKMMRSMIRGEKPKPIEFKWNHKSGKVLMGEARIGVLKNKDKISGFQIIAIDITERKQAEQMLKESEEKFSKVFYANPAIAGLSDLTTGEYIEVNTSFYDILGFTPQEVIGKRASEVVRLDFNFMDRVLANLKKDNYVENEEAVIYTKKGIPINVLISALRVFTTFLSIISLYL